MASVLHWRMPTARPRHMITETDDIRLAIDAAAARWPDLEGDRAALVRKLVLEGARSGAEEVFRAHAEFAQAVAALSDLPAGVFPPGAAEKLRQEWPE